VDVVDDEFGAPTWTRDIATGIVELVECGPEPGIYHATSGGSTSRHGQARAIAALTGIDPDRIRPVPSEPGARPARRPAWSVLGHRRWSEAGLTPLPSWDVSLATALRDPRL
jgi:dTDP-4-dehydrorhamnose reductase